MAQVRVDPTHVSGGRFRVEGAEAFHLIRVLRRRAADRIMLFDGAGRRWSAEIARVSSDPPYAEGRILETLPAVSRAARLRLFQGLPRGAKFDFVLEKAAELGIDEIHPFLSSKSPVELTERKAADRLLRWQRLAESASKQCGRPDVPTIAPVATFDEIAGRWAGGLTLVCDLSPEARPLRDALPSAPSSEIGISGIINVVVGPESGFSPSEREALKTAGANLVSLGPLTLRSETAGLVALSVLSFELNLL